MLTALCRLAVRSFLDAWLARWGILDWLRLLWLSAVFWYELGSFWWSLVSCAWPDSGLSPSQERPAHVLLVADPQVRELSSSRGIGFPALKQHIFELSLKRQWFFASRQKPDAVVFLGDILSSWRSIRSDDLYERNYNKFVKIFCRDRRIPSFFVPGNNDVGLNIDPAVARQARNRFTTHFGRLNQAIPIRNYTFVMLDAAGLVEEDYLRASKYAEYDHWTPVPGGPVEFVRSLRIENQSQTILFSHIPLHRPDTASCGPLREHGTIHRGAGPNYQNTLGKKTSTFLFQTIKPQIVFSADDKDYCEYIHVPPQESVNKSGEATPTNSSDATQAQKIREITVKAFAPSPEIRHPGFQLLSLTSPPLHTSPHTSSFATKACFFPDYPTIYPWRYLPLFLLTTFALSLFRRRRLRTPSLPTHSLKPSLHKSFSLSSLPTVPWSPLPHPPTPFSPDWSPQTPGFFSPSRSHPKRSISSPIEELPREHLRAPMSSASSSGGDGALFASGGDVEHLTPTFRATAIAVPRADGGGQSLPTGPAHIDVDEVDDDFAYDGRYGQRQPLMTRVSLVPRERRSAGAGDYADADGYPPPQGTEERLTYTFTFNGRRRRISLGFPSVFGRLMPTAAARRPGLAGRRHNVRTFVRRVTMDLVYIIWPPMVLWAALVWWMS